MYDVQITNSGIITQPGFPEDHSRKRTMPQATCTTHIHSVTIKPELRCINEHINRLNVTIPMNQSTIDQQRFDLSAENSMM